MKILKTMLSNKLFLLGLLVPIILQLVYFLIAIPAIKDGAENVYNMKITIVNEDPGIGTQITGILTTSLPFDINTASNLDSTLKAMENRETNMVMHISDDFTTRFSQGNAEVTYYIDQAVPSMTKQLMENIATVVNQMLNENAFTLVKSAAEQRTTAALATMGLPENTLTTINGGLKTAFDSLNPVLITEDIQKTNNAEGFAQTAFPFFIFLTYFLGATIMTAIHTFALRTAGANQYRGKVFSLYLGITAGLSIIIPCIVIGVAAVFDIPFSQNLGIVWGLLALGFFTMAVMMQMFGKWFGLPGLGGAVLILFPLQLVGSGLIYAEEILPAAYPAINDYLPASHFGNGILRVFYGELPLSGEVWTLLIMAVIFVAASALSLLKKNRAVIQA